MLSFYREDDTNQDPVAALYLGRMYLNGEGVPQDLQIAVEWFQKAIKQGNHRAMYELGKMYYEGVGVPKDIQQAITQLQKAEQNGNRSANHLLDQIYMNNKIPDENILNVQNKNPSHQEQTDHQTPKTSINSLCANTLIN